MSQTAIEAVNAGEGVGAITDVPSAGELIQRLWREFEDVG